MDETKQPGIKFVGTYLLDVEFHYFQENRESREVDFKIHCTEQMSADERELSLIFEIEVNKGRETMAAFTILAKIVGLFVADPGSNLPLKAFANIQGPALLVPYVRELISNITGRAPIPAFYLDPVNIKALLEGSTKGPEVAKKIN
jgi:preprotein translocase subunit SecB